MSEELFRSIARRELDRIDQKKKRRIAAESLAQNLFEAGVLSIVNHPNTGIPIGFRIRETSLESLPTEFLNSWGATIIAKLLNLDSPVSGHHLEFNVGPDCIVLFVYCKDEAKRIIEVLQNIQDSKSTATSEEPVPDEERKE